MQIGKMLFVSGRVNQLLNHNKSIKKWIIKWRHQKKEPVINIIIFLFTKKKKGN